MKNEFLDRLVSLYEEYHDKQAVTGICPCCGGRQFTHEAECTFLVIENEVLTYEENDD